MKMINLMMLAGALSAGGALQAADPGQPNLAERYRMEQKVFEDGNGGKLNYCRRQIGDWSKPEKAAVVLFFHGAGERGDDNQKQLVHGTRELTDYCEKNNVKALLLFPQCPNGQQWVDTPWGAPDHQIPPESKAMKLAMAMLDQELKNPDVDLNRVYVLGISMGGFGTWDAISRYPEKFAAAFPVCGGVDLAMVSKFKKMPILIYHGDDDRTVLTKRSRDAYDALKRAGADKVTYVEVPNCGHGSWGPAFREDKNWEWLFKQSR